MLHIDKRLLDLQAPCRGELQFPGWESEFEIQAYLYAELRNLGYVVRGEVTAASHRARFDLVIYSEEKTDSGVNMMPRRVIETKQSEKAVKRNARCRKQTDGYYRQFGIPVDTVCGMAEARAYLGRITALLPAGQRYVGGRKMEFEPASTG